VHNGREKALLAYESGALLLSTDVLQIEENLRRTPSKILYRLKFNTVAILAWDYGDKGIGSGPPNGATGGGQFEEGVGPESCAAVQRTAHRAT
jgi:hypothetical protein